LFFMPEVFQDFFFNDFIVFFAVFFFFIILNFFLIFNRTVSNLLSLVFFLILGCVFLLISFKAEFVVYSYLLVYVGGISVLFLFGLMSVNQKVEYQKLGLVSYNKL
jgi:NADH:ubiquinone oxidoreductase subunit 6 (subunit J)